MQTAEIHLPYFKQGDDLAHHLSECLTVEEALEAHAQQLESAVELLRGIKKVIKGHEVSMDADTHMIMISGTEKVIDALIKAEYADACEFEEDEDEEFDEENEEF